MWIYQFITQYTICLGTPWYLITMSITHLHDDMLLHLTKLVSGSVLEIAFLWAFLVPMRSSLFSTQPSGERYFWNRLNILNLYFHDLNSRKELSISECYFLLNKPWMRFFKQYIFPSSITVFDVSHGYWLKAKVICRCITKMENLKDLPIQDTRKWLKQLTELKYASGPCTYDSEVKFFPTSFVHKSFMFYNYFFLFKALNDFCIYHPYLEQLHFSLQNDREEDEHTFELRDWTLPLLKILVYSCDRLTQSNILLIKFK